MAKNRIILALAILLLIPIVQGQTVDTANIRAYYNMDNANVSGATVIDVTGSLNGNFNGTRTNTNSSTGIINEGRGFPNSANQKITLTNLDEGEFTTQFTVSSWLKITSEPPSVRRAIFEQDGGGTNSVALNILPNNTVFCRIGGTAGFSDLYSNITIKNNTMTHLVCRWTQNAVHEIFVNGKPSGLKTSQNANFPTIPDFILGEYSGGGLFKLQGILDEVGFWHIALNKENITNLYNNGTACAYPFSSCAVGPPDTTPPSIQVDSYNVTSAVANATIWRTSRLLDSIVNINTPTVTFTTNEVANCSIGRSNFNYTAMIADDSNTECGTNPATSHTCTLPSTKTLSQGNNDIYLSCQDGAGNENVTSTSNALNITALLPDFFATLVNTGTVFETSSEQINLTLEFRNLSQVIKVNSTLIYNNHNLGGNNSLNGTNTTFFDTFANVPLRVVNNTALNFNWSYTINWLNGSTTSERLAGTQTVLFGYTIQNVTFRNPIAEVEPSSATINITNIPQITGFTVLTEVNGSNITSTFGSRTNNIDQYTTALTPTGLLTNASILRNVRTFLQLNFNGTSITRSVSQIQNVTKFRMNKCGLVSGEAIAMTFNVTDEIEGNRTGVTVEGQIKSKLVGSNTTKTFNYEITGLNSSFNICVFPTNTQFNTTIDFQLRRPSFNTREFHDFRILNSTRQSQSILMSNEASNITIKLSDVNDIIRINDVVQAYKVNQTTGLKQFIDSGRTGTDGKVVLQLIANDNFLYNFIVKDQASGIVLFNSTQQKVKPNEEIFLRVLLDSFSGIPSVIRFRSLIRSLTYNTTANIFTFVFNDQNDVADEICLKVDQLNSSGLTTLDLTCTTNQTGTLNFNASGRQGTIRATGFARGSPPILLAVLEQILDSTAQIIFAEGLFAGLFTFITMTFIGIVFNLSAGIGAGVISLGLMGILGFLPIGPFGITILILLGIMVMVVLRT